MQHNLSNRPFVTALCVAFFFFFVLFLLTLSSSPASQAAGIISLLDISFTEDTANSTTLPDVLFGSLAATNDGQYILVTGCKTNECQGDDRISELYKNTNGSLAKDSASLTPIASSSVAWGDMDNDGDQDILMVGYDGTERKAMVYKQDPAGSFTLLSTSMTGVESAAATWGDFDGNDQLDIIITGILDTQSFESSTKVYKNNGDGSFTEVTGDSESMPPNVYEGGVATADLNNDGKDDIIISGTREFFGEKITEVYLATDIGGETPFTKDETLSTLLPNNNYQSIKIADMESDGDLDILLAGGGSSTFFKKGEASTPSNEPTVAIYTNDGEGAYTQLNTNITQLTGARADWADAEGDGDLDLIVSGTETDPESFISTSKVEVHENTDGNTFTLLETASAAFAEVTGGVYWIDVDGDIVKDVVLSGSNSNFEPKSFVYTNGADLAPTPTPTQTPTPTLTPTPSPTPEPECQNQRCYVNIAATGANDGTSWSNAFKDLQAAISLAKAGDEIWIAKGVYSPGSNQTDTFSLKDSVAIYGGFEGTESEKSERDWETNRTILTGNDTNYHVVTADSVGSETTLDGVIISNGNANGSDQHTLGGGMYNSNSSPNLNNVTFSNNSAVEGGGMFNDGSSPTLSNVTFSGNSAESTGGGMSNQGSNPTLSNVTLSNNSAESNGGGMVNNEGSNPKLTGVTFVGNTADVDGGGMINSNSSPALTDVRFENNSANKIGGGIYNGASSVVTLTNVIIFNNSATDSGGIYNDSSEGKATLTNVTIAENSATSRGGGMYNNNGSTATIINSIFWGNSAPSSGNIRNENSATSSTSYSLIEGSGGSSSWSTSFGADAGNNIDTDPQFVDAANGNLNLQLGSPAIDAGSNTDCPSTPLDGDGDGTATCDMGAFEAGALYPITSTGTISFTEIPSVTLNFTSVVTDLAKLYIDEVSGDHPDPNDGTIMLQDGASARYFRIRALQADGSTTATGFTVDITLPHDNLADPQICRYDTEDEAWDCGRDSMTASTVTRTGITEFSDWLVIPADSIFTRFIYLPLITND